MENIDDAARTLHELHPTPPPTPPSPISPASSPPRTPPPRNDNTDVNNNQTNNNTTSNDIEIDSSIFAFPLLVPLSSHSSTSTTSSSTTSSSTTSSSLSVTYPPQEPHVRSINKTWNEFEDNLGHILRHMGENKVEWTDNWGNMYRHIFTLKTITREVVHMRQPLYCRFELLLKFHVDEQLQLLLDVSDDAFVFLRTYLGKWCGYAIAIKYIHDIFGMHYFWVKNEQLPDIFMFGLNVWREHMFFKLSPHLSRAVVQLLTLIRDTTSDSPSSDSLPLSSHQVRDINFQFLPALVRNQVVMAPNVKEPLELFEKLFVQPYIECTSRYFNIEALNIIGDSSAHNISKFMIKAESRLEEELKRLRNFETSHNADEDETFPDLYHALLHSCWYVCESISSVDDSFDTALNNLTDLVRTTLHTVLVDGTRGTMIQACEEFFVGGMWDDLNRMLRLLTLTNSAHLLEQRMRDHVAEVGITIVDKFDANPKKEVLQYVASLYAMMTHYRTMAHTFPHHKFVQIIDKAFEAVLNKSKNSCRYLAQYCDSIIRGSVKKSIDTQYTEESLDKCADILNYLQDKDIFMVYYVHYLARRLLDTELRSVDNDYEKLMIAKIKLNHGKSFTSKMEQMLRDVTLSADISHNFNTFIRQEKGETNLPELIPTIMETGAWPSSVLRDPLVMGGNEGGVIGGGGGGGMGVGGGGGGECFLPLEVDGAWFSFKAYYLSLYSGRRLVYTPHLGTAEVAIHMDNKDFTATVSTFAMCVLLLFEHTPSLSFNDILSMTNIGPKALKFTLKALSTPIPLPAKKGAKKLKGPPLLLISNDENNTTTTTTTTTTSSTSPSSSSSTSTTNNTNTNTNTPISDEISDNSQISLNLNFAAKCTTKRFKILAVSSQTQTTQSTNEVEDGQKKKREWQVDCIVVRVMKTRRKLQHNALIQEVITQSASHFIPTIPLIKLRIQALIDREFIARDADDRSTYIYLE